jgi:hypothetical protein
MTHDMVLDLCGTTTNFEHYHSLYLSLSLSMLLGVFSLSYAIQVVLTKSLL